MTIVPKIFPSNMGAIANIRPTTVWQPRFSKRDETRVPQTKEDARGKHTLPVGLRGDDLVHQPEETIWVVLNFNVHVELDLLILGLLMVDQYRGTFAGVEYTTCISSLIVSSNVGIDCLGSWVVRTCSIPPSPYQYFSLISPIVMIRPEH